MGQKTHPKGFRLGVIEKWDSLWYGSDKNYADMAEGDRKIRAFLKPKLYRAGISKIMVRRRAAQIEVDIFAARPGMIIGKGGKDAGLIRDELVKLNGGKVVQLNILEEENAETHPQLVAENIAFQLEKRVAFRRVMRQAVVKSLRSGAKGIKVMVAGRLGGSEIARTEWYRRGRVPLHTLRAKITYGFTEAMTMYGKIGVKVWVYRGDELPAGKTEEKPQTSPPPVVEL